MVWPSDSSTTRSKVDVLCLFYFYTCALALDNIHTQSSSGVFSPGAQRRAKKKRSQNWAIYIHGVAFKVTIRSFCQDPFSKLFLNSGALFRPDSDSSPSVANSSSSSVANRLFISSRSHRGKTIHRPAWQTVEFAVYETK